MGVAVAIERVVVGVANTSVMRVRHCCKEFDNLGVEVEGNLERKKNSKVVGRRGSLCKGWWGTSR